MAALTFTAKPTHITEILADKRLQGLFSSDPNNRFQVDKEGLRALQVDQIASGLQSRPGNELDGLEGRTQLLVRLGQALAEKKEYFGENGRPGNMVGMYFVTPAPRLAGSRYSAGVAGTRRADTNTAQTTSSHTPQRKPRRRPSW